MPPSESVYCPTPKITRSLLVALLAASGVSERRRARSRRMLPNTYLCLIAACGSARTLCQHRGFCAVLPCTSPPTRICAAFRVSKPARPRPGEAPSPAVSTPPLPPPPAPPPLAGQVVAGHRAPLPAVAPRDPRLPPLGRHPHRNEHVHAGARAQRARASR